MRGETVIEAPADRDYLVEALHRGGHRLHRAEPVDARSFSTSRTPCPARRTIRSPARRSAASRQNGDYGDASRNSTGRTGEILAALKRLGFDDNTLVVWTSDNGAVNRNPPQGSCAPYQGLRLRHHRGRDAHAVRHALARQDSRRHGVRRTLLDDGSAADLRRAGRRRRCRRTPIDGHDIRPILFGEPGAKSPWDDEGFCYYRMEQLQAVRSGPWKLYLPLENKYTALNRKTAPAKLELYDVRNDVRENREVSREHPDVVERLLALAEAIRAEIGDVDRPGTGQREAGWVDVARPLLP